MGTLRYGCRRAVGPVADYGPWPFGDGGMAAIFERGVQMPSIIP